MQDDRLYDEKELEKSWLISYSDLITLLFVIVVIIAAVSSVRVQTQVDELKKAEAKKQETAASVDLLSVKKLELEHDIAVLEQRRDAIVSKAKPIKLEQDNHTKDMELVKTQLSAALQEMNINFEETSEGLMVRLPEKVLFASGSAELGDQGKQAVGAIAAVMQKFPNHLRIEGYTDNVPISRSPFHSNWELSSARAISVMREMVDSYGLPPARMVVAGWGEYKPLVPNTNELNRAKNRRVEIVILAEVDEKE